MDLVDQIESDLGEAMKLRDEVRTTTLRLLKSALKNYQIETGHDVTMQEALSVLQKEAKKHQDSIKQYEQADRNDLADTEKAELEIIENYLPSMLSEEEMTNMVDGAIKELNASSLADTGRVIAFVREKSGGRVDGAKLAETVKSKLSS